MALITLTYIIGLNLKTTTDNHGQGGIRTLGHCIYTNKNTTSLVVVYISSFYLLILLIVVLK